MKAYDVLKVLADGKFWSGQKLGQQFGISRTAVWHQIQAIREMGLEVFSVQGKGYRLAEPLELLDEKRIRSFIRNSQLNLTILEEVDSTNRYLMQKRGNTPEKASACLAERQTSGRGRRGRAWVSPFGANIYMSLSWQFAKGINAIEGLSLVVAIAVVSALERQGATGLKIKWPNDIYYEGQKLAGILIELAGEASGPCHLVIGIGINVNMPPSISQQIDQPWIDLSSIFNGTISRNVLVGLVLDHLVEKVDEFEQVGFEPFREQWKQYDYLYNKPIDICDHDSSRQGIAKGIDESGALLVKFEGTVQRLLSGDVSVRTV
ncbi:MAG: bifunctional biotin--[acetyl-CoA-carboxylase] ligase/biotin operon repressor BirA [Gammaproteobacteria bacterium]|nr:bifunctional biotin--[acetyl-CoA-carboxylase] ligase/biotin operon repressor BirA [Gammaproteobacteria bacterium]